MSCVWMERAAASATYLYCQQIRSISDKYFELKNKICFIDATIQKAYNVFLYLLVILRRDRQSQWAGPQTWRHEKWYVHYKSLSEYSTNRNIIESGTELPCEAMMDAVELRNDIIIIFRYIHKALNSCDRFYCCVVVWAVILCAGYVDWPYINNFTHN